MELKGYLEENFSFGAVNAFLKKSTKLIVYTSLLNSMLKKKSKIFHFVVGQSCYLHRNIK